MKNSLLSICPRMSAFALLAVCSALVMGTGCRSVWPWGRGKQENVLLGPRQVVPPPYSEPAPERTVQPQDALYPEEPFKPVPLPEPVEPADIEEADMEPETGDIVLPPAVDTEPLSYTVKKGDSLWKIAQMYDVTHQELAAYNDMSVDEILPVGKTLSIPPGGRLVPEDERKSARSISASSGKSIEQQPIPAGGSYTVEKGDSLWVISRRFGVTMDDIRRINDLSTDVLQVGQVLKLPKGAADTASDSSSQETVERSVDEGIDAMEPIEKSAAEASEPDVTPQPPPNLPTPNVTFPQTLDHTVIEGETLEIIAEMYDTTVTEIKQANPDIESDEDLKVNMKILVPFD